MFSFLEVLPLVLEAIEPRRQVAERVAFPCKLAHQYTLGSVFWNFVGAGVMGGGTIHAPLVNHHEHGTFATLNHARVAMFGAFGLQAIGLAHMVLRYMHGTRRWSDRAGKWAFRLYNAGLVI